MGFEEMNAPAAPQALTLTQLNQRVSLLVSVPATQNVWVVAELSDVRIKGGHCYLELIEKDPDTGNNLAKINGRIWRSNFVYVNDKFQRATEKPIQSGIKVMVRGSVNMHPAYGLSFVIDDIYPEYTMGDLLRRRREILARLEREGILNMNQELEWPDLCLRVAVISSSSAAGYGDFFHQLLTNRYGFAFKVKLFESLMQGNRAAPSLINALERIAAEIDQWDCVVMIRGGGATSDLTDFEDYNLASNVAQFPLPIISGLGHHRDMTLPDLVANQHVKNPTAAAEWLIAHALDQLSAINERANIVAALIKDTLSGAREHLAFVDGNLPVAARNAVQRASSRLQSSLMACSTISSRRISGALARLYSIADNIPAAWQRQFTRQSDRLASAQKLLEVLSPQATLARGYSITRVDGHAVTDAAEVTPGATVVTQLANGSITSTVTNNK